MLVNRYRKIVSIFLLVAVVIVLFTLSKKREEKILDPASYIVNKISLCAQEKIPKSCLQKSANDFLDHFSLLDIQEILKENMQNQAVFLNCHETLHYLGSESYRRTGDISKVISSCMDICIHGCYHGAFEGYFVGKKLYQDQNADQVLKQDIQEFCKPTGNVKEVTCIHGAGHGLVFITGGDIPRSLSVCQQLQTDEDKESCYTGVFMENATVNAGHSSTYFRSDDPLYTCKVLPSQYQSICYSYVALNVFPFTTNKLNSADWEKSVAVCSSVPEADQARCFYALATLQTGFVLSQDQMRINCNIIKQQSNRYACMYGTITHLDNNPDPKVVSTKLQDWLNAK